MTHDPNELFRQQMHGDVTREWPAGRQSTDDDGQQAIVIAADLKYRNVRVEFSRLTQWFAVSPEQSLDLASRFTNAAIAIVGTTHLVPIQPLPVKDLLPQRFQYRRVNDKRWQNGVCLPPQEVPDDFWRMVIDDMDDESLYDLDKEPDADLMMSFLEHVQAFRWIDNDLGLSPVVGMCCNVEFDDLQTFNRHLAAHG